MEMERLRPLLPIDDEQDASLNWAKTGLANSTNGIVGRLRFRSRIRREYIENRVLRENVSAPDANTRPRSIYTDNIHIDACSWQCDRGELPRTNVNI